MNTKCWTVDIDVDLSQSYPQISQAADLLQQNEVVAFPTETVYGLGANAESDEAVMKIYVAKGRPSDNPLIVHIATRDQLERIVSHIPDYAEKLIDTFWPGALTLILPLKGHLSTKVTAGLSTVGVRMPSHPLALELIRRANVPIAAPSANLSGKPSPTTAAHVFQDLDGRVAGILDGGATGVGVESTVLDCTEDIPVILRPGGVTKEQLEASIGEVLVDKALLEEGHAPKAPGMKYTHYAPDAPLIIVDGEKEAIQVLINKERVAGKRVGVLTTTENASFYDADVIITSGSRHNLETVAQHLYEALRGFNEQNVNIIYSESFPANGVGQAIMNRLLKAAGHNILTL